MRRLFLLALSALCAAAPVRAGAASAEPWIFLGAWNLDSGTDRQVVGITSERHLHQLQVCVFSAALQLNVLSIHFDDGRRQDVSLGERIANGGCTPAVDVLGAPRPVHSVELVYKRISRFRRAPMARVLGR